MWRLNNKSMLVGDHSAPGRVFMDSGGEAVRQVVICHTCHEAAPTQDHKEVRTLKLLPGWWWLHWRDVTDASNTSQTEGRKTTQLTPTDGGGRLYTLWQHFTGSEGRRKVSSGVSAFYQIVSLLQIQVWREHISYNQLMQQNVLTQNRCGRVTCLLRGMLLASFWTANWLLKSLFFGAQQSRQITAVAVRMKMMKNPRQ